ncbi:MAG: hypothetical protein GX178_03805 [Acidobacteria bacterium]|jgi:hypothetical protein|nr:DUF2007 domain-containing protein [Thermoanaerobaculia bacterium]NLN10718.1 hypothetical protein [Acidobacteriota bacterium]OQC41741.1 MAG: hypothetical protein BWX64_00675 [Acidobacteria bacterium ADurb.Bin051]HNZ97860.1 DUF2007 domain-containing protein [Thermoanaerobaculia bacterium]HPA96322.1 DUF2007 domain-containing protein [Thermoanaerobaculia bacterium]
MSEEWRTVEVLGTEEEATLVAGFLENQGIPARIESLRFTQEPVNFGGLSEIRVHVPADRFAEAEALLASREQDVSGQEADDAR